jgi:hypothetical protein
MGKICRMLYENFPIACAIARGARTNKFDESAEPVRDMPQNDLAEIGDRPRL